MLDMSAWTRPVPGSGRVLFPPEVRAGESLVGLVFKAAEDNVHSNVGAILEAAGYPHARAFNLALARFENLPRLAQVLGVAAEAVEALAHRKVREAKTLTTVRFMGAEIPSYDLITKKRRISPTTITAEPFHRAVWTHGLLPYCPHSLDLLVAGCPECGSRLDWFRACGVQGCSNADCEADLRHVATPRLDPAFADQYRRMARLAAPLDAACSRPRLHRDIDALDPGAAFELGWRLARVFETEHVPRPSARNMPPEQIVRTLRAADDILMDWPEGFATRMRRQVAANGISIAAATLKRFRASASTTTGWPKLSELLHATCADMLRPGRAALRSLHTDVLAGTDAHRLVGISAARFAAIKRSSKLSTLAESGGSRAFHDFDRKVVETLAEAKNGSTTAKSVVNRFGIAFHGVEQLVVLGFLKEERHAALRALSSDLRVTKRSVDDLVDALQRRGDIAHREDLPLHWAVKAVRGEKPWGEIVKAMLDGRIAYHFEDGEQRLFQRFRISRCALPVIKAFRFDRADHPDFDFASDMTRRDAEKALNLVPGQLPGALSQEIGRNASRPRVAVRDVSQIALERISAAEIMMRTGPAGREFLRVLERKGIKRRGLAGWDRLEVQPLLEEHETDSWKTIPRRV